MLLGFNAGGFSWVAKELGRAGVKEPEQLSELVQDAGFSDALCAAGAGGQCLRVFTNVQELVGSPQFTRLPFQRAGDRPLLEYSLEQKLERLDQLDRLLDELLERFASNRDSAPRLDCGSIDRYLAGVAGFNATGLAPPVRILLTFVEFPPQWILEAPSAATCRLAGRNYSFHSLWHKWTLLYIAIARAVVRRLVELSVRHGQDLLAAVEIANEPDYEWLPDEYRIEKALAPVVNPLNKYVTELHLHQIPGRTTSRCIQPTPWGTFEEQDGEWAAESLPSCPLIEFPWGPKLDWYIKAFADLHTHLSFAVRDELYRAGYAARIVSCSVTHNNVLYFAQLYGANPETFTYVDAIGIHPYHFPRHNVRDDQFRGAAPYPGWPDATPREYARDCFKHFDFIEEISRLASCEDPSASFGLAGKKIWITEFGIPTKSPGKFNREHAGFVPLILRRGEPAVEGREPAVWEDLWDAFFHQVQPDYLRQLGVEAFFFYALRETSVPGFDKHDDDRSNFSLFTRDGESRMDAATARALRSFAGGVSGKPVRPDRDRVREVADRLGGSPAGSEQAWERRSEEAAVHCAPTMLSRSEKRLLYWLAHEYYSGGGAIVDAGCFLGGSTVALAQGLLDRGGPAISPLHSYDLFEADEFMAEHYLPEGYRAGDSFLPLYEHNIEAVKDVVRVHAGDLQRVAWTEGPIEILFIDIAKSWETNDHLVRTFFGHLIPGRSIVVQQDYVHEWCPWLHVTMERLAGYFEPVGFVEHNSMVYRLKARPPEELLAAPVSGFSPEEKLELMHRSVNRFHGAQRGLVECAEATLLCQLGRAAEARTKLVILENRFAQNTGVLRAIQAVRRVAEMCLGNPAG